MYILLLSKKCTSASYHIKLNIIVKMTFLLFWNRTGFRLVAIVFCLEQNGLPFVAIVFCLLWNEAKIYFSECGPLSTHASNPHTKKWIHISCRMDRNIIVLHFFLVFWNQTGFRLVPKYCFPLFWIEPEFIFIKSYINLTRNRNSFLCVFIYEIVVTFLW